MLRFAICDLGVSIPYHLRTADPSFSALPDHEVLHAAFLEGVSGDKQTRFGSGLPYVRDTTLRCGGALQVYSGNAVYRLGTRIQNHIPLTSVFRELW